MCYPALVYFALQSTREQGSKWLATPIGLSTMHTASHVLPCSVGIASFPGHSHVFNVTRIDVVMWERPGNEATVGNGHSGFF